MTIKGILKDRMPLINNLASILGSKPIYAGAPTFVYYVGPYTITREGHLQCDSPDLAIIHILSGLGLVEEPDAPLTEERNIISVPLTGFTGHTMTNIICVLAAKGDLLNKSIGMEGFCISPALVAAVKAQNPSTLDDFRCILYSFGGEMKGLRLTTDKLVFTGFPTTADESYRVAWQTFVNVLVNTAKSAHHLKFRPLATLNDKFTFRTWLNSIGLKGPEYKTVRAIMLERMEGDSTFRTREQRETYNKTRKRRRVAEKSDFVAL